MFSTPLICCSRGATTVAATTSALAPGYWPLTLTTGGAISGYWATGSRPTDTAPTMTKTIETTAAKIGRSMKKWEMRMGGPAVSIDAGPRIRDRRRVDVGSLGRDLDARARPHQAIDDDVVLGHEAADDPQAVDDWPEFDVFRPGDVLRVDDDRKSTRLNSSHDQISYAVFCLKKKKPSFHEFDPPFTAPYTAFLQQALLI